MALKYIGDGKHIPGVPARDLTDEEQALYGDRIADERAFSGVTLYEPLEQKSGDKKNKSQEDKG